MASSGIPARACICVTRHEEPHSVPNLRVTSTIAQQHHPTPRLRPHRFHLKTMHKPVTATKPVQQRSPFLSLPPELRLIIYSFALQDTLSSIATTSFQRISSTSSRHILPSKRRYPPIVGALALLFTSREIQAESSDAMRILGDVFAGLSSTHNDTCVTQLKRDAIVHGRPVFDKGVWDTLHDQLGRLELMNSVRLIIMRAYSSRLHAEIYKRGRRL
jgi:hypothetical protein